MNTMSANKLSIFLVAALIALLGILVGGSALAASTLLKQSQAATRATIDTDVGAEDPTRLEGLKKYLADNTAGISQTASLTAGLGQYNQSSIVAAINGYASKAGVSITSFDFGADSSAAAGAATSSSSTNNTVNITIGSPVKYSSFITFLKLLEQGLMPAQIMSGGVSSYPTDNDSVVVSPLSVKVAG